MLKEKLKKISENIYEIPKEGKMNVPVIVYASDSIIEKIKQDKTLEQAKNMAMMQGVTDNIIVLPDAHQGYGSCIGGVAAFDIKKGVISPGQIGYDINCSVRLLRTNLPFDTLKKKEKEIANKLYETVPPGVGKKGSMKLSDQDIDGILKEGAQWLIKRGYGEEEDYIYTEDKGMLGDAEPKNISQKAKARGRNQLGTLGAGNHFLELQEVVEIYDKNVAKIFGLEKGQIVMMIHCGSRGLGHQTASDYIMECEKEYGFTHLPDRELVNAPINSALGKKYLSAMAAAANFAFANKQMITHRIRETLKKIYPTFEAEVVYDICHNMAKFEKNKFKGKERELLIIRKGATRSFGPNRKEIPKKYQKTGCPIFIPGSMGTYSYVLVGTNKAEKISLASTAHGAGRVMSRTVAKKQITPEKLKKELESRDIFLKASSISGALEEAPQAYKDVNEVVRVSNEVGIGNLVAKMRPLIVIKG